MNDDLKELYKENIMLGDLSIDSNEINFTVNANYGQELGSIYSEMNNNKINMIRAYLLNIESYFQVNACRIAWTNSLNNTFNKKMATKLTKVNIQG